MVEIELTVLKGQFFDRWIPNMATIQTEVAAWERDQNNSVQILMDSSKVTRAADFWSCEKNDLRNCPTIDFFMFVNGLMTPEKIVFYESATLTSPSILSDNFLRTGRLNQTEESVSEFIGVRWY